MLQCPRLAVRNVSGRKIPRRKKGLRQREQGLSIGRRKSWGCLDTLAAAYAESRDFDQAKEWEAKAIALATTDKSATEKDKAKAAARLELYKQGKPYREAPKK